MSKSIIYIVSDSLGETAEMFAKAGLSQFSNREFRFIKKPFLKDLAKVDEVIEDAVKDHALIVYTLIQPEIRAYMDLCAKEKGIFTYDVFGSFIETVEKKYQTAALRKPGLSHQLDEEYFKRIEALEFAVKNDDGKNPKGILMADIVLIGISRTSKTPLSQFLAYKGIKVANLPLVPEVEPPEELFSIPPHKCIGLYTSAEKLNRVRKERLKTLGLHDEAIYADIKRIKAELVFFEKIMTKLNCKSIDVSNRAIEETASVVMKLVQQSMD